MSQYDKAKETKETKETIESKESNDSSRLSGLTKLLTSVAGLALAVFLICLYVSDDVQIQQSRSDTGFIRIQTDTCREIQDADAPIGIRKEYSFSISDTLDHDTYLAFYTVHQYVEVWLDGQQIHCLMPSADWKISETVGSNWTVLPIYREDAGKEMHIMIMPVYESVRDREVIFLMGSMLEIYQDRLRQDMPQLLLGILAVFVGLVFLCIAANSLSKRQHGRELAEFGLFSLMMGVWRLTDTRYTPLILPEKPVFLFYLSVAMLMIGMIPLIRALKRRFDIHSCRMLDAYCAAASVVCMVQLSLQVFRVMDLRNNLFVTHIVIVVGILLLVGNVIYDRLRYPEKYRKMAGKWLPLICLAGVLADVIAFYIRRTSSGLLFSLTSLFLYVTITGISIMFRYSQQEKQLAEKDRQLAEQERQLTENRIATMISQIQPHFIYNTLGTIGQFCLEDPVKASELVQKFSMYLRGNFTELGNAALIRISQELEHVRYYAEIEQIRFPDMQVIYDLKADEFMVPALTVQPLVENAIKHGLMGLESGGTVTISTYETPQAHCICVKDDGVGFDDSVFKDGRKHIGIQNIRGRLEAMCGGSLTIDSVPGEGTTALILIPKEGVK